MQVHFLGDEKKELLVIDTPGTGDRDMHQAQKNEADLWIKLRTMQEVHIVLIMVHRQILTGGVLHNIYDHYASFFVSWSDVSA